MEDVNDSHNVNHNLSMDHHRDSQDHRIRRILINGDSLMSIVLAISIISPSVINRFAMAVLRRLCEGQDSCRKSLWVSSTSEFHSDVHCSEPDSLGTAHTSKRISTAVAAYHTYSLKESLRPAAIHRLDSILTITQTPWQSHK